MLVRSPARGGAWAVRPAAELDGDLSARYGFPIDAASKRAGFAGVARALERGELALAQISALLLRLPEPPGLGKGAHARGSAELAAQLFESGPIKADWDPSQHPRTGEAPNPGWFAAKDDDAAPDRDGAGRGNDEPVQVAGNNEPEPPSPHDPGPPPPDLSVGGLSRCRASF